MPCAMRATSGAQLYRFTGGERQKVKKVDYWTDARKKWPETTFDMPMNFLAMKNKNVFYKKLVQLSSLGDY
jgi:hypothetical protein